MSTAPTRGRDDCATATLLATLTRGLSVVREPRLVRARFEEELRALLKATSITLMSALVQDGAAKGEPRQLFRCEKSEDHRREFDVTPDGERFLFMEPASPRTEIR